jgi:DNA-binding HxlR family transcriptional regulator
VTQLKSIFAVEERKPGFDVEFSEKKGTYEFLRLLMERPRRWKALEKELPLSPRTLSERITQAQTLGFIEIVRRLKIGAPYYRLTKKGNEVFEIMTGDARIY